MSKIMKVPDGYACDVPHDGVRCMGPVHLGWGVIGHLFRVCKPDWLRHCDDNDNFDLHDAFNLPRLDSGHQALDRFGFEMARDDPELNHGKIPTHPMDSRERTVMKKGKRPAKTDRSQGNSYYNQPKATAKRIVTKRTTVVTDEKNDIFDGILGEDE